MNLMIIMLFAFIFKHGISLYSGKLVNQIVFEYFNSVCKILKFASDFVKYSIYFILLVISCGFQGFYYWSSNFNAVNHYYIH